MSSLFVRVKEKQFGPFSKRELRKMVSAGKFSEDDMVWNADIDEWVQAKHIDDLKAIFPDINFAAEKRRVIAVGGGKGGVGKTVLSASLGVGLAALGKQVVMVDADLGGANLHTCMGIIEPEYTFFDFYFL